MTLMILTPAGSPSLPGSNSRPTEAGARPPPEVAGATTRSRGSEQIRIRQSDNTRQLSSSYNNNPRRDLMPTTTSSSHTVNYLSSIHQNVKLTFSLDIFHTHNDHIRVQDFKKSRQIFHFFPLVSPIVMEIIYLFNFRSQCLETLGCW